MVSLLFENCVSVPGGGGGALGYFLGGYVPPGTPNWHPVLKKKNLKVMPRSRNGPIFVYPVLEFVLKLIPRSGNRPVYPRWRSQRSRLVPKYARPAR